MSVFSWFSSFLKKETSADVPRGTSEQKPTGKKKRARDTKGRYLPDDPTTKTNEAWVNGN